MPAWAQGGVLARLDRPPGELGHQQQAGRDERRRLVATGLLRVAELAWWSVEPRVPAWAQGGVLARRLGTLVLSCAGALFVSALVVVAGGAPVSGGTALELVGVAAAAGALAVVALVARKESSVD